ncbi:MAG: hypothetical protein AAFV54_01630 [Pseudomonadota bacterium]
MSKISYASAFALLSMHLAEAQEVLSEEPVETSISSDFGSALKQAFADSKLIANARIRYEHADFSNFANNADALTFRLRLGAETGALFDTKFLVEFEYVEALNDNFNSTRNGEFGFPVVADPEAIELNRIQFQNTSLPDTTLTLGRQRIIYDDSRFVGNVGFRQKEQTFDAFRVTNKSLGQLTLDFTYLNQANRIFGDEDPAPPVPAAGGAASTFEGDSFLVNASHPTPLGQLTAFAYLIDIEEVGGNLASQTYGARLAGQKKFGPGTVNYQASYANQSDYESNTANYNTNYYLVEGTYGVGKFFAGGGVEFLGGDNGVGFSTPFATLHKFNGFADVFLATPAGGLRDAYAKAGVNFGDIGPFKNVRFTAWYHDFNTDEGNINIGDEFDFRLWGKIGDIGLEIKYGNYFTNNTLPGAPANDVERLFIFASYAF